VICDNLSAHKAPAVHRWLLAHPRFVLHFTPTYSSWINQVDYAELVVMPSGSGVTQCRPARGG
jgi:transposase